MSYPKTCPKCGEKATMGYPGIYDCGNGINSMSVRCMQGQIGKLEAELDRERAIKAELVEVLETAQSCIKFFQAFLDVEGSQAGKQLGSEILRKIDSVIDKAACKEGE